MVTVSGARSIVPDRPDFGAPNTGSAGAVTAQELSKYRELAGVQIDVRPLQADQLALPHTRIQGQRHQGGDLRSERFRGGQGRLSLLDGPAVLQDVLGIARLTSKGTARNVPLVPYTKCPIGT